MRSVFFIICKFTGPGVSLQNVFFLPTARTHYEYVLSSTQAQNVCPGWPVYDLKCLCCRRQEWPRMLPLPPVFLYLILMTWRTCNLNLVTIFSLASKWQALKVGMPFFQPFYEMTLKTSKFKVSEDIMTQFKSQGVRIMRIKYWNASRSGPLPHSQTLEHRHFTS